MAEVCVICQREAGLAIIQTETLIILHITRKPNSKIVLLFIERIKTSN